jgi:hypothetical protein
MTLQPLKNFKSLETHHCVTGSMQHIYHYHDFPVSEDMLLGLGAGVGFIYWHMKGTYPIYGGRANMERPGEEGLEKTASRRLGVNAQSFQTSSLGKAEKSLLELLASDEPVMVLVDMGFLPYFDFPEEFHFGGHMVVVAGYDPSTKHVLIADRDDVLHPVSLDMLAQARGSKFKPFPPRNVWYTFDFTEKHTPQPEDVKQAIYEMANLMLNPPISNIGINGIRKAAQRTLKWPEVMSEDDVRGACFNTFIFIDAEGGTGGGIFRYMLGRFLTEAAVLTKDDRLAQVGDAVTRIGDRWQDVAQAFKSASEHEAPASMLAQATVPMNDIADQEETVWKELAQIVHPG